MSLSDSRLLIGIFFITLHSFYCQAKIQPCYNTTTGEPLRCAPLPVTFSLGKLPIVNSTCGDPPNTFCRHESYVTSIGKINLEDQPCSVCDSNDPDNSHGPELMTDFSDNTQTWWQSKSGEEYVSIEIDLCATVEVTTILFNFYSFKPGGFYILRSSDNGATFEPFHYLAHDCLDKYMIDPEKQLTVETETDVLCQRILSPNPGGISFVPGLNRPSFNDSVPGLNRALYDFITVTNIRVILDGFRFPNLLETSELFYSLENLAVLGRCQCNGHANNCSLINGEYICECSHNTAGTNCERCKDQYNDLQWDVATGHTPFECQKCECNGHADSCVFNETLYQLSNRTSGGMCTNCTDNTGGPKCDQCVKYYYPNLTLPASSVNYCQECGCNTDGTVNGEAECERFMESTNGQCDCKPNVMGRTCDMCKDGYFNFSPENEDGCQQCGCNTNLTINNSITCDAINGTCSCKPNTMGDKCDTCEPGFFYLSDTQTCSPCNCNLGGSLSPICDVTTGQCPCREGVIGRTCSEVAPGRYVPFLDHIRYEAEESMGSDFEYSYHLPSDPLNTQYTGSGYVRVNNTPNATVYFGNFTPPISGLYEFVLRYRSMSQWDSVRLRLVYTEEDDGTGTSPSGCIEHSDPNAAYYYTDLPMAEVGAESVNVCLRQGRTYQIILDDFQPNSSMAALEIDSMVVFFSQPDGLAPLSMEYTDCTMDFKNLLTRGGALDGCKNISFNVLTEIYNRTLECDCDSDGSVIGSSCNECGGQCDCKTPFNIGRDCGTCAAGSYINETDADGCTECSCFLNGSIDPFCNQLTGQCSCLQYVTGPTCDTCVSNASNFQPGIGCEDCKCHPDGSSDPQCLDDGSCMCKTGFIGTKCNICDPKNFNFPICSECNCNEAGSINLSCTIEGECSCRVNTNGPKCDSCISESFFNLNESNYDGCQPCFCSGVSGATCTTASGYISSVIQTLFNTNNHQWMLESQSGMAQLSTDSEGVRVNGLLMNEVAYLVGPEEYLGNRLGSYRQYLTLYASADSNQGNVSDGYDILLEGVENTLVANFTKTLDDGGWSVRFIEGSDIWFDLESDIPVMAYQLQSVLINLINIKIRVSLGTNVLVTSVSMVTAEEGSGSPEVGWVEECNCAHPNYTGLSCESCSKGYYRANSACIECNCNGYSNDCDESTGTCFNCTDNTTGDRCEECVDGYYGDPANRIHCQPCTCPSNTTNGNQYSPTCELSINMTVICTQCADGHIGDMCESCDTGYYGDPLGMYGNSTKCTNCSCNGNIDPDDPDSCNKTNGICTKCLGNTAGNECEECGSGYYGDAIYAKNCTACECDLYGSVSVECNTTGDCSCHPNITGSKCTECIPFHYNGSAEGCSPCDCDLIGSHDNNCSVSTGQCSCKPGVDGRRCDVCALGHFNFNEDGCENCGCSSGGAVNASCNDDGVCMCNNGVIGDKCDQCDENYFLTNNDMECSVCPSCYTEVQGIFNTTRDRYIKLHIFINTLGEPPNTTFNDTIQVAITNVTQLNKTISDLVSQYGELHIDLDDLLTQANQLNISAEYIHKLIDAAEGPVSTYNGLYVSSNSIVEILKQEIYAGSDVLNSIQTMIYPYILNNTNQLNDLASQSNTTLLELNEHVNELQSQTTIIHELAVEASSAANTSLTTSDLLTILSMENNDTLSTVQQIVTKLNTNMSIVIMELTKLNLTIIHGQVNISNIETSLPVLPSLYSINSLINTSNDLTNEIKQANESFLNLLEMYQAVNNTFAGIQAEYDNIVTLLSSTSASVSYYFNELSNTLDSASIASNEANSDLAEAESILADLRNFSDATSRLKAQADEAFKMAAKINKTLTAIEEMVSRNLSYLRSIHYQLEDMVKDTTELEEGTQSLQEKTTSLLNNSMSLLNDSNTLMSVFNTNQDTIDQLYSDVSTANMDINEVDEDLQIVKDTLYSTDVQGLASEAEELATKASEVVSGVENQLMATPVVDQDFLDEVLSLVSMAFDQVNSTSISDMYNVLVTMYEDQEDELITLNENIDDIRSRVSRLEQIMASLPSDCASSDSL